MTEDAMMDKIVHGNYTHRELLKAFNEVANEEHWKNPIDSYLKEDLFEITNSAVEYFTGSSLIITQHLKNRILRVSAKGYYLTIGA